MGAGFRETLTLVGRLFDLLRKLPPVKSTSLHVNDQA